MKTPAYRAHKAQPFRTGDAQAIARNLAFVLFDANQRRCFALEYRKAAALY